MIRRHFLLGSAACVLLAGCRSVPPLPTAPVTPEQARYLRRSRPTIERGLLECHLP